MGRTLKTHATAIALALLAILNIVGVQAAAPVFLKYQPAIVTLTGTISEKEAFGPPGYGADPQTDRKESYLLLTLDAPICVEGNPKDDANSESETNVVAVQMVYSGKPAFKKKWLHKHVSVDGTLFHALTGHHRTAVLIEIKNTRSWTSK